MKNLKVKSILFSLMAMMAVAVFLTSCEQTSIEDTIIDMNIQSDEASTSPEDLPVSPEDVWAAVNGETSSSDINNIEEDIESRACTKIWSIEQNHVTWTSTPQYALWIYHYNSNGNFISYTRKDVPYCTTRTRSYSVPSNRCTSVAFVGYQHWGRKIIACR